jgi:hypothetical protein
MAKPAKPKPRADRVKLNLNDASETRVVGQASPDGSVGSDGSVGANTTEEGKA